MIKLNDHYYISWLKVVKNYDIKIEDKKIFVNMTLKQHEEALVEYQSTHKPILKQIRKFVRELNVLTA